MGGIQGFPGRVAQGDEDAGAVLGDSGRVSPRMTYRCRVACAKDASGARCAAQSREVSLVAGRQPVPVTLRLRVG